MAYRVAEHNTNLIKNKKIDASFCWQYAHHVVALSKIQSARGAAFQQAPARYSAYRARPVIVIYRSPLSPPLIDFHRPIMVC